MVVWNPGRQPGLDRQVADGGKQQKRHEKGRLAAIKTHQAESATNYCQYAETGCKPHEPAPQQYAAHQRYEQGYQRSKINTVVHGKHGTGLPH